MKDLAGSVTILTGASRGIGAPLAEALADRGARVVLAARNGDALERVCEKIKARGGEALAVPTDITNEAARASLISETLRVMGSIDLLINNAGIVEPAAYDRLSPEQIREHIALNLEAPMMLTREVLPTMIAQRRGHIVNIGSLGGLLGIGWGEPYTATKHGIVGFTRALRIYCRASNTGVTASVVCPGFIDDVGMYADRLTEKSQRAPFMLGTSSPADVIKGIFEAIDKDCPEVIVSSRPVRMLVTIGAISPRLGEWLMLQTKAHTVFEVQAQLSNLDSKR